MNRFNLLLAILLCLPASACVSAAQAAPSTPRVDRDRDRSLHTTHSSTQVVQIGARDDSGHGGARPLEAEPRSEGKSKSKATARPAESETGQVKPRKRHRERDQGVARGQNKTRTSPYASPGHANNDHERPKRDPKAQGKPRRLHSTHDRACKISESYAARSKSDETHPDSARTERKRRLEALRADRQCKKHRAAEQRKSAQGSGGGTH